MTVRLECCQWMSVFRRYTDSMRNISENEWRRYVERLAKIDETAAKRMQAWITANGTEDVDGLIDFAFGDATKYGEAAAALACEMYDAAAAAQGAQVPPAEPAETATYDETAKAVRGTLRNLHSTVSATVGRLVKQAGADTMLKNARRDGAEFAWIPWGTETCAFCITLASRGWQRASKAALDGGHAEHIHANCFCEYAVRFDGKSNVAGYDPDRYLDMYYAAGGSDSDERIRNLRRELESGKRDQINAQKRAAYARRKEALTGAVGGGIVGTERQLRIPAVAASSITKKVEAGEYSLKLSDQNYNKHVEGHRDYERYAASREAKGQNPPSVLTISKEEAQEIINKQSGTGIIRVNRDGTPRNIEDITCDRIVGKYYPHGIFHETNKAAIHHGSQGSHLIPQSGGNYD